MNKATAQWCLLILLAWLSVASAQQQGAVRSSLSAATISMDESVVLTVEASGLDGELDTGELEQQFDIVGSAGPQQYVEIINGRRSVSISWALELMPREVGVFTVPAVIVDGEQSQIHTLTVTDIPVGQDREVFVEAEVDQLSPWVQSQVILTVRVFEGIRILEGSLGAPKAKGLQVQALGDDREYEVERDGREYKVIERRFALFPQQSGALTIDPVQLVVAVPADRARVQGHTSSTRRLTRRTRPIVLEVQARPLAKDFPVAAWWLPAAAVELEASWATDIQNVEVDQSLTRTISLRALGVQDTQLPDIEVPTVQGLGIYADDPERASGSNPAGLVSELKLTWAVIPQAEGTLTLPAIEVPWFDTRTGEAKTAVLPEETVTVRAAGADKNDGAETDQTTGEVKAADGAKTADGTDTADDEAQSSPELALQEDVDGKANSALDSDADASGLTLDAIDASGNGSATSWFTSSRLLMLAVAASIGWLVTGVLLWLSRRRERQWKIRVAGESGGIIAAAPGALHKNASLTELELITREGDLPAIARATLSWAARQWPNAPPTNLNALASALAGSAAAEQLRALDAALYRRDAVVEVDAGEAIGTYGSLPQRLRDAIATQPGKAGKSDKRRHLPAL